MRHADLRSRRIRRYRRAPAERGVGGGDPRGGAEQARVGDERRARRDVGPRRRDDDVADPPGTAGDAREDDGRDVQVREERLGRRRRVDEPDPGEHQGHLLPGEPADEHGPTVEHEALGHRGRGAQHALLGGKRREHGDVRRSRAGAREDGAETVEGRVRRRHGVAGEQQPRQQQEDRQQERHRPRCYAWPGAGVKQIRDVPPRARARGSGGNG